MGPKIVILTIFGPIFGPILPCVHPRAPKWARKWVLFRLKIWAQILSQIWLGGGVQQA